MHLSELDYGPKHSGDDSQIMSGELPTMKDQLCRDATGQGLSRAAYSRNNHDHECGRSSLPRSDVNFGAIQGSGAVVGVVNMYIFVQDLAVSTRGKSRKRP